MFIICPNYTTQGEFNLMEITRNNQRLSLLDLSLLSTLWFNMQIRSQTVCLFLPTKTTMTSSEKQRKSDHLIGSHSIEWSNRIVSQISPHNLCLADLLLLPAEWKQTNKQTHKHMNNTTQSFKLKHANVFIYSHIHTSFIHEIAYI